MGPRIDSDDTYDESDNPSNGWRAPDGLASVILPDVKVRLTGKDGNAFFVLGTVKRAMEKAGHRDRVKEFMAEATSGDYDRLLGTCMKWVDVS